MPDRFAVGLEEVLDYLQEGLVQERVAELGDCTIGILHLLVGQASGLHPGGGGGDDVRRLDVEFDLAPDRFLLRLDVLPDAGSIGLVAGDAEGRFAAGIDELDDVEALFGGELALGFARFACISFHGSISGKSLGKS